MCDEARVRNEVDQEEIGRAEGQLTQTPVDGTSRRLKRVCVTPEMFVELLRSRTFFDLDAKLKVTVHGVPADARACRFGFDSYGNVVLVLQKDDWPELVGGEMIPEMDIGISTEEL